MEYQHSKYCQTFNYNLEQHRVHNLDNRLIGL